MNLIRNSNTLALLLGGMWSIVISVLISVAMSFLTGLAFKPNLINSAALGTIAGVLFLHLPSVNCSAALCCGFVRCGIIFDCSNLIVVSILHQTQFSKVFVALF